MISIEEALFRYLSGYAGLSELVGDRIYPDVLPQKVTMPAVKHQRIDTPREYSHSGDSNLAHPRFQFSGFALTKPAAKAVADQIRAAFNAYNQGRLNGTIVAMGGAGGVDVQFCQVEDERSDYEPETLLFRTDVDVILWQAET